MFSIKDVFKVSASLNSNIICNRNVPEWGYFQTENISKVQYNPVMYLFCTLLLERDYPEWVYLGIL